VAEKEEEKKFSIQIPPFDEKEFIRRDLAESKLAFAALGYAFMMALLSWALSPISIPLAALIGLAGVGGIWVFPPLLRSSQEIRTTTWLSTAFLFYIIPWFAFWWLLSNPFW